MALMRGSELRDECLGGAEVSLEGMEEEAADTESGE
jgi:hypothetical protein